MEQKKKGGIRIGAGRKPSENPKRLISLYVEKKAIWLFGNEEKLKNKLYEFIHNYNSETPLPIVQKQKDYSNNLNQSQNWTQQPIIQQPQISHKESYAEEISEAKNYDELKKIIDFIATDDKLNRAEKIKLNQLANYIQQRKGFYPNG